MAPINTRSAWLAQLSQARRRGISRPRRESAPRRWNTRAPAGASLFRTSRLDAR